MSKKKEHLRRARHETNTKLQTYTGPKQDIAATKKFTLPKANVWKYSPFQARTKNLNTLENLEILNQKRNRFHHSPIQQSSLLHCTLSPADLDRQRPGSERWWFGPWLLTIAHLLSAWQVYVPMKGSFVQNPHHFRFNDLHFCASVICVAFPLRFRRRQSNWAVPHSRVYMLMLPDAPIEGLRPGSSWLIPNAKSFDLLQPPPHP